MFATRVARMRSPFCRPSGTLSAPSRACGHGPVGEPHREVVVPDPVEIERSHLQDDGLLLTEHHVSLPGTCGYPAVMVVAWGQRGWVHDVLRRAEPSRMVWRCCSLPARCDPVAIPATPAFAAGTGPRDRRVEVAGRRRLGRGGVDAGALRDHAGDDREHGVDGSLRRSEVLRVPRGGDGERARRGRVPPRERRASRRRRDPRGELLRATRADRGGRRPAGPRHRGDPRASRSRRCRTGCASGSSGSSRGRA